MEETSSKKNHQKIKLGFFVLVSFATFYLAWKVFHPYLMLIATAVVAAIVLAPFHLWLSDRIRHHGRLSALLATLITMVAIGIPIAIGILLLVQEVGGLQTYDPGTLVKNPLFEILPKDMQALILSLDLETLLRRISDFVAENIAVILTSTSQAVLMTLLFFVTLYYLLAEREALYRKLLAMSPLSDKIDNSFIRRLTRTIRAVVLGSVVVGFVQGILAGIGFMIFGVPNALIWGLVTLVAAQIPMIGTAVVTVPAAIYLFAVGNIPGAIGLGIWGLVLVGTIDNLLKPKLVEGKTDMHPLLILLAMFGGLEFFGPVGFILGPAVLAATLAFLEMYETGVLGGNLKL